jgi:hypothetical protein
MLPNDLKSKRILISPLNWGLGHVTRCLPLIHSFLNNKNDVFIACNKQHQAIFSQYFNQVHFIEHEDYPFKFRGNGKFTQDLGRQFFSLQRRLKKERIQTEEYVTEYAIDYVISDHRYGFHSNNATSIFLTHQIHLPVKWCWFLVQHIHIRLIKKFDLVWIPDDELKNYAGKLSHHHTKLKCINIGVLSRFSLYENAHHEKKYSATIIASGPEIYAKQFLAQQLSTPTHGVAIIASQKILSSLPMDGENAYNAENWLECDKVILQSKKIISRSGYSTLMDLVQLNIPFELHPTNGQAEQEYLAEYWRNTSFVPPLTS